MTWDTLNWPLRFKFDETKLWSKRKFMTHLFPSIFRKSYSKALFLFFLLTKWHYSALLRPCFSSFFVFFVTYGHMMVFLCNNLPFPNVLWFYFLRYSDVLFLCLFARLSDAVMIWVFLQLFFPAFDINLPVDSYIAKFLVHEMKDMGY